MMKIKKKNVNVETNYTHSASPYKQIKNSLDAFWAFVYPVMNLWYIIGVICYMFLVIF